MNSVMPALSFTGEVFGIQATAVNPPTTADRVPVAIVSLCSWPGSRRWTCMSIKPGQITSPDGTSTTTVSRSGGGRFFSTRAMRSPSISTSNAPSSPRAGSTTRPPLSSRFMFNPARQQIEHRHAHRHTVGDLFENHRIGPIGHFRGDLDAAIHRTGVHDDRVRPRQAHALLGHAEHVEVLAQRREERAL